MITSRAVWNAGALVFARQTSTGSLFALGDPDSPEGHRFRRRLDLDFAMADLEGADATDQTFADLEMSLSVSVAYQVRHREDRKLSDRENPDRGNAFRDRIT